MNEDIVHKARRKGRLRGRLTRIVDDMEYVLKMYEGRIPFPSVSHIVGMIGRYDTEDFRKGKLEYVQFYGAVLGMLSGKKELPNIDKNILSNVRTGLLDYSHNIDF